MLQGIKIDSIISETIQEEDDKMKCKMKHEADEMKKKFFNPAVDEGLRDKSFRRLLGLLETSDYFAKNLLDRLNNQKPNQVQFDNCHFWDDNSNVDDTYSRIINGGKVSDKQPKLITGIIMQPHQIDGYIWLKTLYEQGVNGILADEMGLGKTLQCIALVSHLIEVGIGGPFMICAPLSILPTWIYEFYICAPSIKTLLYHGPPKDRQQLRNKFLKKKSSYSLILTSYEIAVRDRRYLQRYRWKYMILDEGHRIKNYRCQVVKELKRYTAVNRLLLTGTPLQNDLSELWSLLNYLLPDIFTDLQTFESWFDISVLEATNGEETIMHREQENRIVATMHDILTPFLLRRTKDDIKINIPVKKEILIFVPMALEQRTLYRELLKRRVSKFPSNFKSQMEKSNEQCCNGETIAESGNFKENSDCLNTEEIINESRNALDEEIVNTDQPVSMKVRLRSSQAKRPVANIDDIGNIKRMKNCTNEDSIVFSEGQSYTRSQGKIIEEKPKKHSIKIGLNITVDLRKICNHPYLMESTLPENIDENLINSSGKMIILDRLLTKLKSQNHKVLIYSQMKRMLDILENYCELRKFDYVRLDGSMSMDERSLSVTSFHERSDIFIFLLSTRAGGLGLNLSSADTVVIYDSDWNPQRDLQAQDRCHRIGQTKPVLVYRLITQNSVDQEILQKAASKRKLEKIIIKKGRFLTGCHGNEMSPGDLFDVLQSDEYGNTVNSEEFLSDEQLTKLTDRSDLYEDHFSGNRLILF